MKIPIQVSENGDGFRAELLPSQDFCAEGPTAVSAMESLRGLI